MQTTAKPAEAVPTTLAAHHKAFRQLVCSEVVEETHDTRSFVLDVPPELKDEFEYHAGQFLTFLVEYEGVALTRCYSMSSAPDSDSAPIVTIKRVDGGRISNWFNDHVVSGTTLTVLPPSGHFVLRDHDSPVLLFAGGSGVTPVFSIAQTALAHSKRRVKLVYANRDEPSVIFKSRIDALAAEYPNRFTVQHNLDSVDGYLDVARVEAAAQGLLDADVYVCGPGPFMDVVEEAMGRLGVARERFFIERFVSPADPEVREKAMAAAAEAASADGDPENIAFRWEGKTHLVPYLPGETLLETAIRAKIDPPYSCEEAYCSSCQAKVTKGTIRQALNDCLSDADLEAGLCLPCQAYPTSREIELDWDY